MSLDYLTTAGLMHDADFISRTKVACLHFASYISGEDDTVPAHNSRMRWAQQTFASPDQSAVLVMPVLVMDDKVQESGSAITDPDLQSAVETSVNKFI
jgi:hypothetical protein